MTSAEQQRELEQRHVQQRLAELLSYADARGFVLQVRLSPHHAVAVGPFTPAEVREARGAV